MIINSGAIIEHEVVIKDNVHIAPNASILGNVKIEKNSFFRSISVLKEGTVISEPYPVYNTTPEKLEEEFCRVIKNKWLAYISRSCYL